MKFLSLDVKHPFSLWIQISSFSFFLAGNFSDLLIIRICLSSAYVFLFLNSILGAPLWPSLWMSGNVIQLDGIIWSTLNLYVHITTVVRLLRDEWSVPLSDEHLALWRMFYRTGGLSQRVFQKTIAEYCDVITIQNDNNEKTVIDTDNYFYIIYKGTVQITVTDEIIGKIISSRKAQSGQLFDFRSLGLLQDHDSLIKHKLEAIVVDDYVTLFRFNKKQMIYIANHPNTRLMWKEILMENLLRIVQRYFDKRIKTDGTKTNHNNNNNNNTYINPIFLPLQPLEEPHPLRAGSGLAMKHPFAHILASAQWSFAPPWPFQGPPMGLRHTQLLAPGRVQNMPPKRLMDASEGDPLLVPSSIGGGGGNSSSCSIASPFDNNDYHAINNNKNNSKGSTISKDEEDEEFLEYLHEIDEEMGGMHLVNFKREVSKLSTSS